MNGNAGLNIVIHEWVLAYAPDVNGMFWWVYTCFSGAPGEGGIEIGKDGVYAAALTKQSRVLRLLRLKLK
jgi:hypothetical protein